MHGIGHIDTHRRKEFPKVGSVARVGLWEGSPVAVVQGFVHAWQVHRAAVQEHKLLVACQVRAAAGLAGMGLAHKAVRQTMRKQHDA
eukprot:1160138-Pelagomonas_calceolata.AAC.8